MGGYYDPPLVFTVHCAMYTEYFGQVFSTDLDLIFTLPFFVSICKFSDVHSDHFHFYLKMSNPCTREFVCSFLKDSFKCDFDCYRVPTFEPRYSQFLHSIKEVIHGL